MSQAGARSSASTEREHSTPIKRALNDALASPGKLISINQYLPGVRFTPSPTLPTHGMDVPGSPADSVQVLPCIPAATAMMARVLGIDKHRGVVLPLQGQASRQLVRPLGLQVRIIALN